MQQHRDRVLLINDASFQSVIMRGDNMVFKTDASINHIKLFHVDFTSASTYTRTQYNLTFYYTNFIFPSFQDQTNSLIPNPV